MRSTSEVRSGALRPDCAAAKPNARASVAANRIRNSLVIKVIRPVCRHCLVEPRIPRNIAFKGLERVGPDARKAVQLELQENRLGDVAGSHREPLQHHPADPTVALVFETGQSLDDAFVLQGVVEPPEPIPAAAKRPLTRDVELVQLVTQIAITHVQRLEQFRLIPYADGGA